MFEASESYSNIVQRKIKLRVQNLPEARNIRAHFGLSDLSARVLAARGFKADKKLKDFLAPTLKEGMPDPKELKNLPQACELIKRCLSSDTKIAIACDFDVDGLSGGSQVYQFLKMLGAQVSIFVPDRFSEGYGLNQRILNQVIQGGFGLLITIDFGTSNAAEFAELKKHNIKSVVIDHHHVEGSGPGCDVFVNPEQPGCGFGDYSVCASALAWYLLIGMRDSYEPASKIDLREFLDLACLGTICDMVPLIGPNRVLAKRGLEKVEKSTRLGLVALKNVAGINGAINCHHISFGLGPRINAAGRMVNAEVVIELLTTEDSKRAVKIANELDKLNGKRKEVEDKIKKEAVRRFEELGSLPAGLVIWDPEFHTGVIGIVAQRLVEDFYRPAVVLGEDQKGIYKGSVRGIAGFSVVEALAACSEHLIKFGGHAGAGGLSIEESKLEIFQEVWAEQCALRLEGLETAPSATADTEATLPEITLELVNEFRSFQPFGVGNSSPQVLIRELTVVDVKVLKDTHLKATFAARGSTRKLSGLMWRKKSHPALRSGARVNLVFKPEANSFNGFTDLQANIQAVEEV